MVQERPFAVLFREFKHPPLRLLHVLLRHFPLSFSFAIQSLALV